jgi:hypothetical protein
MSENAPRSRKAARFTQREITRVVEGVERAGHKVASIRVEPNGSIEAILGTPSSHSSARRGGSGEKFRDIADVL